MNQPSIEAWCRDLILTTDLDGKLRPPPAPRDFVQDQAIAAPTHPGRPPGLQIERKTRRSFPIHKLNAPIWRARLLHRFLHHELQAAELMAWAILRFPDAPIAFRRGMLGIALDEIRHLQLYDARLAALGWRFGDFPVRDWFWERVPGCKNPTQFVATFGMGLEAGNLDHSVRWAAALRQAGDEESAALQETIGAEEVAHVRFAIHWFHEWTGDLTFARWQRELVPPLSARMFRNATPATDARLAAGFGPQFLAALNTLA